MPWGTPWWPYAVALGAANTARQLIQPDDVSTAAEITIFLLMIGVVTGAVTFVHIVLWRRMRPTSSQTRPRNTTSGVQEAIRAPRATSFGSDERLAASLGTAVDPQLRQEKTSTKWAPWWLYVSVILGVNYLRQAVMPVGTVPEWAVVLIALAISATLFITITYVYRAAGADQLAGHSRTGTELC